MCQIIAIYNRKGGSAKSTLASTLAVAMAALGKETLLIDVDTQGSLSVAFGMVDEGGRIEELLAPVLQRRLHIQAALRPIELSKIPAIPDVDPAPLYLLPGASMTDSAIRAIEADPISFKIANTQKVLSKPISELPPEIEYVILDLGPSHPTLTAAAFIAADYLLIPTLTDFHSVTAVNEVVSTMNVYQDENPRLKPLGIVPTLTRRGTINHDVGMATLQANCGEAWGGVPLFDDIPYRTIWAQASWDKQTILTYRATDQAAQEAWHFVEQVLGCLEVAAHV